MSLAGVRSNRGDEYQRSVAIFWVIKMLSDSDIQAVEVDAISTLSEGIQFGDDIVIYYISGNKTFIQAKVNQKKHQYWRFSDDTFKQELIAAGSQLQADASCECHFYSRTPFGDFQRLVEEFSCHHNYQVFTESAPINQVEVLNQLSVIWNLDCESAYHLIKRIKLGDHHSSEQWSFYGIELLKTGFNQASSAYEYIYNYITKSHNKLETAKLLISREDILSLLQERGIHALHNFDEKEVAQSFRQFSLNGRQWVRSIGGEKIERSELARLKELIDQSCSLVLLEDVAGGGKTCILLDLLDDLDKNNHFFTLFIKGDLYAEILSLDDFSQHGLSDILSQCAGLAQIKPLVVIADSLDVLAVGRSHKSLRCLLGLIAELSRMTNVTVIAASRSFDIKYDPLLREVKWDEKVLVTPLVFEEDITHLLSKWGVNQDEINATLKKLLVNPQNLRLFYEIISRGVNISDINEGDLYDSYLREVIEKDDVLSGVLPKLQDISLSLLKNRSYEFSRDLLNVDISVYQRLLSQQVVTEVEGHQLMFSHQTLADALRIRKAQQDNVDLSAFVLSQPQLPFVRPAIRSFILYLRANHQSQFVRQFTQLILNDAVSMHVKRLAIETLCEFEPIVDDSRIIMVLYSRLPILFNRFLMQATNILWFSFLKQQWEESLSKMITEDSSGYILRYFSRFFTDDKLWVINLWNRIIDEDLVPIPSIAWDITDSLNKLESLHLEGVSELLGKLLESLEENRATYLGKAISRYVKDSDEGDKLLWDFVLKDSLPIAELKEWRDVKLNCERYDLVEEGFFRERVKASEELFQYVMDYILLVDTSLSDKNEVSGYDLLYLTSWERENSPISVYEQSSVHELIDAIGDALIMRAKFNDVLWIRYEALLREKQSLGLRYLLHKAYMENVEDNVEGISYQLTDRKLLRYNNIKYDLYLLTNKAYPYLTEETCRTHQSYLISLYDDFVGDDWVEQNIYTRFLGIPCIYMQPQYTEFIEKCEKRYGFHPPLPGTRPRVSRVFSPLSDDVLLSLNAEDMLKAFTYYHSYNDWAPRFEERNTGGRESLVSALRGVSALLPMKFVPLVDEVYQRGLCSDYILAVIEGLADHLRARFGNSKTSEWKEVEPLEDGFFLADILLGLVEKYGRLDIKGYSTVTAIQACCFLLTDDLFNQRIYFQLWKIGANKDPDPSKDDEAKSLIDRGINSIRGRAAEACMILATKKKEQAKSLDQELIALIKRYSRDPSMAVRAALIRYLPYLMSLEKQLGWDIMQELTHHIQPRLIKHLGDSLYYQYHHHFDLVKPYLDMLKQIDDEKSSAAFGRLWSLSYLSGHISKESLWSEASICHEGVYIGMADVFSANLSSRQSTQACVNGLIQLMELDKTAKVYSRFEFKLSDDKVAAVVPDELIQLFLEKAPAEHVREIDGVFHWFERHVQRKPDKVLELLEIMISRLGAIKEYIHFHNDESLIITIRALLQEADLSDDECFVNRVLTAQDWFLTQGGLGEMEKMLEANE